MARTSHGRGYHGPLHRIQTKIGDYFERHSNAIGYFPGSFIFPILLLMILSFPPMVRAGRHLPRPR